MNEYLDFASATRLLASQGFNRLDIHCVLDLTGPQMKNGVALWRTETIERLAGRAYWLGTREVAAAIPHVA